MHVAYVICMKCEFDASPASLARIGYHVWSEDVGEAWQAGESDPSVYGGWRGSRGSARLRCGASRLRPMVANRRSSADSDGRRTPWADGAVLDDLM